MGASGKILTREKNSKTLSKEENPILSLLPESMTELNIVTTDSKKLEGFLDVCFLTQTKLRVADVATKNFRTVL